MSVFSNVEIRHAIMRGHLICHPFTDENVRGSSIDVTLGEFYYECNDKAGITPGLYNPFDQEDVERYFGAVQQATPARELGFDLRGIDPDHPIILLKPRSRILAHTNEFVGIKPPGTSEMRARSSWGRNGISVCLCAGWGDPGYYSRWTMEISNFNDEAVPLPVGERIAQMIFHRTGTVSENYADGGKYQSTDDVKELVLNWKPEMMLPRAYKDQRRLPVALG